MRCHMDENHQDGVESKLISTDNQLWIPPLSMKDQKRLDRLRKKSFIKWIGTGLAGKTSWDVIQLLLIPLVLAGAGYWFSYTQMQSSLQSSQKQHDTDLQIAADQQRETTLKTSLDDLKDLLLNKSLRASKAGDEVRVVARVEALAALRQLDGKRKGQLIQFLFEAGLIIVSGNLSKNPGAISLYGANLSDAILNNANLAYADLSGADLHGANLSGADAHTSSLYFANLQGANLDHTILIGANLSYADCRSAKLSNANLGGGQLELTHLDGVDLDGADLDGADLLGADLIDADMRATDLRGANLSDASLSNADMRATDSRTANFEGANFEGANLERANLRKAKIANEQLKETKSLKGTIMPDGSTHP